MVSAENIIGQAEQYIATVNQLKLEQAAQAKARETLATQHSSYKAGIKQQSEQLDIVSNAVAILTKISDDTVGKSYEFIKDSLNGALARVFEKSPRQIELREYTRSGAYPQLELMVITENGVQRSLKDDSGHGISQIISLLTILSLIVITGQRRFLVLDEMLSGLSSNAAKIVSDILWAFADIGFQFVISEHGLVVKGSQVYVLESRAGVSSIKDSYIEPVGVYLDGSLDGRKRRAEKAKEQLETDGTEDTNADSEFPSVGVEI